MAKDSIENNKTVNLGPVIDKIQKEKDDESLAPKVSEKSPELSTPQKKNFSTDTFSREGSFRSRSRKKSETNTPIGSPVKSPKNLFIKSSSSSSDDDKNDDDDQISKIENQDSDVEKTVQASDNEQEKEEEDKIDISDAKYSDDFEENDEKIQETAEQSDESNFDDNASQTSENDENNRQNSVSTSIFGEYSTRIDGEEITIQNQNQTSIPSKSVDDKSSAIKNEPETKAKPTTKSPVKTTSIFEDLEFLRIELEKSLGLEKFIAVYNLLEDNEDNPPVDSIKDLLKDEYVRYWPKIFKLYMNDNIAYGSVD